MTPRFRVDLGVMAIEECSTLLRAPELEPHHQMQFSVIPRTRFLGGDLLFYRECSQRILSPSHWGKIHNSVWYKNKQTPTSPDKKKYVDFLLNKTYQYFMVPSLRISTKSILLYIIHCQTLVTESHRSSTEQKRCSI